jgi:hypothetical protein
MQYTWGTIAQHWQKELTEMIYAKEQT